MTPAEEDRGNDIPAAERQQQRPPQRKIDTESLKGLAHPLRVQLFDLLSQYGPATASGLADRLGESSGATSYHLRQLARHGFVREIEGRGTARERWWERVPGGIELGRGALEDTPGARAALGFVLRQWHVTREALLEDFIIRGRDVLGLDWFDASLNTTANLRLTREQLAELRDEWEVFSNSLFDRYRGHDLPGSRPVQLHMNAFPLVEGEETPK